VCILSPRYTHLGKSSIALVVPRKYVLGSESGERTAPEASSPLSCGSPPRRGGAGAAYGVDGRPEKGRLEAQGVLLGLVALPIREPPRGQEASRLLSLAQVVAQVCPSLSRVREATSRGFIPRGEEGERGGGRPPPPGSRASVSGATLRPKAAQPRHPVALGLGSAHHEVLLPP